jgi:hypothetical protein
MRGELPQTSRQLRGLRPCRLTLLQMEFLVLRWLGLLGAMLEIERFTQGFLLLAERFARSRGQGKSHGTSNRRGKLRLWPTQHK